MENIENAAYNRYELNLQYFKKEHIELYDLIQAFELAIEKGQYKEQFTLEYINGGFDLKEISSGEYFYNQNPLKALDKYLEKVNLKKDESSIKMFPIVDASGASLDHYGVYARKHILDLMSYVVGYKKEHLHLKEVNKFIFFGIELGMHIEPIHKIVDAHRYFIVEDHIEKFRLSLFVTEYYEIAKRSKLYFSVYEQKEKFLQSCYKFLRNGYNFNYLIKYTHTSSQNKDKLSAFLKYVSTPEFDLYPYQLTLDRYTSPIKFLQQKISLTNIYQKFDKNVLDGKPLLVIAAGPSLGKEIEWLSKNHKKFIIIAVSTVLNLLEKNSIVPDIVVSVDAEELVKEYFEGYTNKDFLRHSISILSNLSHETVINSVEEKNRFIFDISRRFKSEGCNYIPACVGSFAYLYALSLEAPTTYLLGLDLAVDQATGKDHLGDYNRPTRELDMESEEKLSSRIHPKEMPVKIEGNFKEEVYTTPLFDRSISVIHNFVPQVKKESTVVYNLSNGAKIAGAEPLHAKDIDVNHLDILDKKEFYNFIRSHYEHNSTYNFSEDEIIMMNDDKKVIQSTRKIVDQYIGQPKESNPDLYIHNLILFAQSIYDADYKENNIALVYEKYFEYALNIIYDFFNTKELENVPTHIKAIDKILLKGIESITKQFEEVYEY